jgi:hypothetical protein
VTTIRFEKVDHQVTKRLPCPDCGKKVRRQTTLWQTISPFNRNAEGQPKTELEIVAELRERAQEWQQQAERCTPCAEAHWAATRGKGGA